MRKIKKMKNLCIVLLILAFTGCAGNNRIDKNTPAAPVTTDTNQQTALPNQTDSVKQTEQPSQAETIKQTEQPGQTEEKAYVPPEMIGEISISIMQDREFLTNAAEMFMTKYPDVKITINDFRTPQTIREIDGNGNAYEYAATPDEEFSSVNYINQLNTKIMSGKAEDIIFTNDIPVKKYTDMGVFEDLSYFLRQTPEINGNNYYMSIFEAMKDKNDRLYELPLTSDPFLIIYFDKELVTDSGLFLDESIKTMSYAKAQEYAKQLADNTNRKNTFLDMYDGAQLVARLMDDNYKDYIDLDNKKAYLNTEKYIGLLNRVKDLETQGYFNTARNIDFYNMEYHYAMNTDFCSQAAAYALIPNSSMYHPMPLSDADGNVFTNPQRFAINGASKNKELAWEFLKFLLSEEVQSLPSFWWGVVNKNAFNSYIDRNYNWYGNGQQFSKEDYKILIESWIMQVNTRTANDNSIDDFIFRENIKFYAGKQSAEETAKIAQARVDQILNE